MYLNLVKSNESAPEYTVYIYHLPENQLEGQSDWEMRGMTNNLDIAMYEAQSLFESRNFKKVEVKQRMADPASEKVSDISIKIYEQAQAAAKVQTCFAPLMLLLGAALSIGLLKLLIQF